MSYELARQASIFKNDRRRYSHLTTANLKSALEDPRLKRNKDRKRFLRKFYEIQDYTEENRTLNIDKELGLEKDLVAFVSFAENFLNNFSRKTFLNLKDVDRVWPSALVLFVSQLEWIKLTSENGGQRISSSDSNSDEVNQYLTYCGFYNYVGRSVLEKYKQHNYDHSETVKIRVERQRSTEERHNEITDLVSSHANLSEEHVERFNCSIMSEVLANVTEHGVPSQHAGWFVLAQCHKKSGIISICIGDNGIGIRNSLLTGGQRKEMLSRFTDQERESDSEMIIKSLNEYISGAIDAEPPKETFFGNHKLSPGSHRGRGLKRIVSTCKLIGAEFTLLSQRGCVSLKKDGTYKISTDTKERCFAGTLYHFVLPAKPVKVV